MGEGVIVLVGFELLAAMFVGLGAPLKRRKVRPNWVYGFRTPATLRDERLWYEVNARTGEDLIGIGLSLGVLVGALFALGLHAKTIALGAVVWMVAGCVFMVTHGLLVIRQQKRMQG
jgi:uncharacterized membrane protein